MIDFVNCQVTEIPIFFSLSLSACPCEEQSLHDEYRRSSIFNVNQVDQQLQREAMHACHLCSIEFFGQDSSMLPSIKDQLSAIDDVFSW